MDHFPRLVNVCLICNSAVAVKKQDAGELEISIDPCHRRPMSPQRSVASPNVLYNRCPVPKISAVLGVFRVFVLIRSRILRLVRANAQSRLQTEQILKLPARTAENKRYTLLTLMPGLALPDHIDQSLGMPPA